MSGTLQLISGTFGLGKAEYGSSVFLLPGRISLGVERVSVLEVNGTILQSAWGKRFGSGVSIAVAGAQLGALTGLFAGGIALVGPYALTAAAIGAGVGLLGGGNISKTLIQVVFDDGRGFVAVAASALPDMVRSDMAVARRATGIVALPPPIQEPVDAGHSTTERSLLGRVAAGAQRASQTAIGVSRDVAKDAVDGIGAAASGGVARATSIFCAARKKALRGTIGAKEKE